MNILVIPDSHVRAATDLNRWKSLGEYAAEHKPEVILHLGDWADMPSLSSYDVGKKEFEGRTYQSDINSTNESIEIFEAALYQKSHKKKRTYNPIKIVLKGNHENRIARAVNLDRKLDGTISYDDFDFERRGWRVNEFLNCVLVEGVAFSHYFVSGVLGKAIGGEHPAASLIKKQFASCVVGHGHMYDYAERTDANGKKLQALVAGCFLAQDQVEAYAGPAQKMWRNCISILKNVKDGQFDFEVISTKALEDTY